MSPKRAGRALPHEVQPAGRPAVDEAGNALTLLLQGLFDYAGMFPPAALSLPDALHERSTFPNLARTSMLAADMVVTLPNLTELDAQTAKLAVDAPLTVCVVGVTVLELGAALDRIRSYAKRSHPNIQIVSVEAHGERFGYSAVAELRDSLGRVRLFLEPRWSEAEWSRRQGALFRTLARLKASGQPVGLKVRGVGPTAVSPRRLARLIVRVAELGIPFKVTQGLHHPILEARYQNGFGFLNTSFALRWAQTARTKAKASELEAILQESDAAGYVVGVDGQSISWRGRRLDAAAIRRAQFQLPFTVGSCSLREPDEDLIRLFGPA